MKLTGRKGVLRIYDSADVLHEAAPRTDPTVDMVRYHTTSGWENVTDLVKSQNAVGGDGWAGSMLNNTSAMFFVGSTVKFGRMKYVYFLQAADSGGALILKYYNGSSWATIPAGQISDGTYYNGSGLGQDGVIGFPIPRSWQPGGGAYSDYLDSDKYYIMMQFTTNPNDPTADVMAPCDGQFFEVAFASMDCSGPLGRKLTEELLVLDRNTMNSRAHYIKGPDDVLYEPMELSFAAMLDDTYNKDDILEALACGNPGSTYWTAAGTTSKGTTKNDGSNDNPAFVDAAKKCVNVQILWSGATYGIGLAFYEVYFPNADQGVAEGEDAITLSCRGGVYGAIETIHGFGNRY